MLLEIAVTSAEGVDIAATEGAHRVELTTALELGGLTPSQGLMESGLEAAGHRLGIHPLVRCRPGDFLYSEDELRLMEREVRSLVGQGADGVVIGALTPAGIVDRVAMRRLAEVARNHDAGVELTFHRAIDQVADPFAALDVVMELGFTRVLSSGQHSTVAAGLGQLRRMREHVGSGIQLMAGGGLALDDVAQVRNAGLDAIHLSAKKVVSTAKSGTVSLGAADGSDPTAYMLTDAEIVRAARAALQR
ncbi:copper homeostasis protein CutC [Arthrobacter sp. NPDC090010]|uniref:copper homeostasis protein CutC n=1 Tax=Arthrobacter sp. NPDC090010 TaxID=3363942 RepID=UPI003810B762